MTTIKAQLESCDCAIHHNIEQLRSQRQLLSQNVLAQLRNLVEGVAVLLHTRSPQADFSYDAVTPALSHVARSAQLNFIYRFHKLIQKSASHYTLDGDASERLMLKYFEYLYRLRTLVRDRCELAILENLEYFPVDLDPSLREYHEKIAERIEAPRSTVPRETSSDRYYIHGIRPFFVHGRIYYEVTFYRAINRVNKFDRLIGFTDIDMTDKYAAMLSLRRDAIQVLNQTMPITVIHGWEVSIRPCEINNFARIFGIRTDIKTNSREYRYLMSALTTGSSNLLDLIDLPDDRYEQVKAEATSGVTTLQIFPVLDALRRIVNTGSHGTNVLRYLTLRMRNQIVKPVYDSKCERLSNLRLSFGCIPFDTMPFCTSLPGHNPRYWDLLESIDTAERQHELLARRVTNNVEQHGVLYTPDTELDGFGDIDELVDAFNRALYYKHRTHRSLCRDKKHVFVNGYENDTVSIVHKLQSYASSGIEGYAQAIERWLTVTPTAIDDPGKANALKQLFVNSRVALIYGAAGTGKSTMVDHVSHYFSNRKKLFLAHTHPAVENLRRKVTRANCEFRTISSHIRRNRDETQYDLLIIDECSTVSNADLLTVLERTSCRLIVLVGDEYQIESIQFGNWFSVIRSFIPKTAVFELTTPFRTSNAALLDFWNKVRCIDDDIAESIARHGYSTILDKSLFEAQQPDEIILCLNYDGLYGINNINRFLQSSNPGEATIWRVSTYKIGDPVLFFETERFRSVIHNNLKGTIVAIDHEPGRIQFDVKLDRHLTEFDVISDELEWRGDSTVRFSVYEHDTSDEDDDSVNTTVPFQVAYAVSIHKAQGLEYDSVKVVITDANEDDITHSIFYTAVTRARAQLRIFWTPETQQRVLQNLHRTLSPKDVHLLAARRSLRPVEP